MKRPIIELIAIGVLFVSFVAVAGKNPISPSTVSSTTSPVSFGVFSNELLSHTTKIRLKFSRKLDCSGEIKELSVFQERLLRLKLQSAAFFTEEISKLQNTENSQETISRLEQQRKQTVQRHDEIARLLNQVIKNSRNALFLEKLNDLISYLSPVQKKFSQSLAPARGATAVQTTTAPKLK